MKKRLLSRQLYRVGAVRRAAAVFQEVARIDIDSSGKGDIEVKLEPLDPEVADVVMDEFLNYALVETISDRG